MCPFGIIKPEPVENWLESTLIAPRRHKSYGKQTQGGPPQRDVRLSFKTIHGEQAGKRDSGGSAVGARHIVREHDTTQPVLNKDIKRAQVVCPWSPSQEGARGQGSSACRGTPSRGEARALHHQPVPALTLTMPCISCSLSRHPSPHPPSFTQSPSPSRSLVRDGQTSPHRPPLLVSRTTC